MCSLTLVATMGDISVVMAAFNAASTIARSLTSVLDQTLPPFRVIVIDDGSTDHTVDIARGFGDVEVVSIDHAGLGAALNAGFALVDSEFVAVLDSDDLWPRDRLAVHREAFGDAPSADIVLGTTLNVTDTSGFESVDDVEQAVSATGSEPVMSRLPGAMTVRSRALPLLGHIRTDVAHAATTAWISSPAAQALNTVEIDSIALYRMIHGNNMGVTDAAQARQDWLLLVRQRIQEQR